jgi:hypothetical protein
VNPDVQKPVKKERDEQAKTDVKQVKKAEVAKEAPAKQPRKEETKPVAKE